MAQSPPLPSIAAAASTSAAARRSRKRLLIAIVIAVVWIAALGLVARLTANPVTLNAFQILDADFVAVGEVSANGDAIAVDKEWKHDATLGTVRVDGLTQSQAVPGQRYIVPLSGSAESGFRVTPTLPTLPGPIVYPSSEESVAQLQELLKRHDDPDEWRAFLGGNSPPSAAP